MINSYGGMSCLEECPARKRGRGQWPMTFIDCGRDVIHLSLLCPDRTWGGCGVDVGGGGGSVKKITMVVDRCRHRPLLFFFTVYVMRGPYRFFPRWHAHLYRSRLGSKNIIVSVIGAGATKPALEKRETVVR